MLMVKFISFKSYRNSYLYIFSDVFKLLIQ